MMRPMDAEARDWPPVALYGCMGLGGSWDDQPPGPGDIDRAEAVIHAALGIGITWFDHADIYTAGKAEAVFGEVLARTPGLRERVRIQTKCGIRLPAGGRIGLYDLSAATIRQRVEQSLERLRTDVIDVLLLHRPDPLADPAEVAGALTALHDEGLVAQVGVSNMSHHQIAHLQSHLALPLVANQLEMSLARRDWVEAGVLVNTASATANGFALGTIEHCVTHGINLQAWGSLARGRYTGLQEAPDEVATASLVTSLARAKGTTPEAIVLWWLQRHPARIAPVIGTTDLDRIRACADAVGREPGLTHEEWYELWITARGDRLP